MSARAYVVCVCVCGWVGVCVERKKNCYKMLPTDEPT